MIILFLCVTNSARSQMAEGLAKNILGDGFTVLSAGSNPSFVHSMAVRAMSEINIDIGRQFSKSVSSVDLSKVDKIITLCKEEVCPLVTLAIGREH